MSERCMACGKPIVLIHAPGSGISLQMAWVHASRYGRIKNRDHRPIPAEYLRDEVPR